MMVFVRLETGKTKASLRCKSRSNSVVMNIILLSIEWMNPECFQSTISGKTTLQQVTVRTVERITCRRDGISRLVYDVVYLLRLEKEGWSAGVDEDGYGGYLQSFV